MSAVLVNADGIQLESRPSTLSFDEVDEAKIESLLQRMTLQEKIGQVFEPAPLIFDTPFRCLAWTADVSGELAELPPHRRLLLQCNPAGHARPSGSLHVLCKR